MTKITFVRLVFTIALKNWNLQQLDINNELLNGDYELLNGDLVEEVDMDIPHGYKTKTKRLVCKLNIYIWIAT